MTYKYSENAVISRKDNMVLLFNSITGLSTKITMQCLNILEYAITNHLDYKDFQSQLADDEDREYFDNLFKLLVKLEIIMDTNIAENEEVQSVTVEITHRCNLCCKHCSVSAGTLSDQEYLSNDDIMLLFEQIVKLNPSVVVLSGGEPMVRKNFFEIARYIKNNSSAKLGIMSNAILISEKNVDELVELFDSFDLSLDGINEETCSKVRGKNVFQKVINSVNLLKSHNAKRISLSMVDVEATHKYINDFNELNKKLGTFPMIRSFEKQGRGLENSEQFDIQSSQGFNSVEMNKLAEQLGNEKRERRESFSCSGGRQEFFIDYKGDIYPCAPLNNQQFKLLSFCSNRDFAKSIISKEYRKSEGYINLEKLMPYNSTDCSQCPYNMFCWSCLHDFYESRKDKAFFSSRCELKKKELKCMWG